MRLSFHRSDLRRVVKAASANCHRAFVGIEEGKKFVMRGLNIDEKFSSTISTVAVMRSTEGAPAVPTTLHVIDLEELATALDNMSGNAIALDFGEHGIEISSEKQEEIQSINYYDSISYQPWPDHNRVLADMSKPVVIPAANFVKIINLSLQYWDYRDIEKMKLCIKVQKGSNLAQLIYDDANPMIPRDPGIGISNTMHLQMVPESWSAKVNIDYINRICKSLPSKSLLSVSVGKKMPVLEVEVYLNDTDSIRYTICQIVDTAREYDFEKNGLI